MFVASFWTQLDLGTIRENRIMDLPNPIELLNGNHSQSSPALLGPFAKVVGLIASNYKQRHQNRLIERGGIVTRHLERRVSSLERVLSELQVAQPMKFDLFLEAYRAMTEDADGRKVFFYSAYLDWMLGDLTSLSQPRAASPNELSKGGAYPATWLELFEPERIIVADAIRALTYEELQTLSQVSDVQGSGTFNGPMDQVYRMRLQTFGIHNSTAALATGNMSRLGRVVWQLAVDGIALENERVITEGAPNVGG